MPPSGLTRLYVATVIASGAVTLAVWGNLPGDDPLLFACLLLLGPLASTFKIQLPLAANGSTMSVSYAVDFAALVLLGEGAAIVVAAASAWAQCLIRPQNRPLRSRVLFSIAALAATMKVTGSVYASLGGPAPGVTLSLLALARPLAGAALAYFACNTLLVAIAIALTTGRSLVRVWNENFIWSTPGYFVGAGAAAVCAVVVSEAGSGLIVLLAAPIYLTYRTYRIYFDRIQDQQRHVQQVSDLHLATIEALALAIAAKDQSAHSHIRRVQVYAAGVAEALGMPADDVQGVRTAALLHDIGKLAVPEHILSKPGPLTRDEFQKIRIHPQVGAEIISGVPFPYPVAPLILSHHERWDGKGYPAGLKGEDIPLGARILTVVDYFDALISERPYHRAATPDEALALLREERGKALDTRVVDTFVAIYPELAARIVGVEPAVQPLTRIADDNPTARPATGLAVTAPAHTNVFQDIALAHREIYALYEIAQAMGAGLRVDDSMALISAKLRKIVPFSSCALFLIQEDDSLRCRFATGVDAEVVRRFTIRSGEGLVGWVARTRRSLINARPSADFTAAGEPVNETLRSALMCPLIIDERLLGVLAVYHSGEGAYSDDHRRIFERVAEQATPVISNSLRFEQTQEDSLTDALTGLPNSRYMVGHLTRELARAARLRSEVSVLVLDLDHFKTINDTHGHHVGDRALREVAAILRAGIRPYDVSVRYAGDEFVVVLSGCGIEEAERKRQELQRAVAAVAFAPAAGVSLKLGISIGSATYPQDGSTRETLLATADGRMYDDKTRRKTPAAPAIAATQVIA